MDPKNNDNKEAMIVIMELILYLFPVIVPFWKSGIFTAPRGINGIWGCYTEYLLGAVLCDWYWTLEQFYSR